MKKSILSALILAVIFTAQIKSYFIRGSIYEKDGQFIVLLGDIHILDISSKQQCSDLIQKVTPSRQ